ncbi:MAG TPA: glycosyl hydrolase, partial [Actinospica sp.]|nr:glycosyl hydrolase [Actinospica sp.]
MNRPRFGVNYTPSQSWFHHWLDFDIDAVRADLDAIAALGLDHVRVFPLWPVFQPNRSLIRPRAVEQLAALVDAAGERGLDVNVDGLQGHLSSFDFRPSWISSWHRRNMFTDPEVVEAEAAYLRTLAAALADRPNFLGMTLGNETNQFSGEPHPDPDRLEPEQADAWLARLLEACEEGAPGRLHLHSFYDAAWYLDDHPFTPAHAARRGFATAIHAWVFNGTAQTYGTHSTAVDQHAAYLIELSKAWALDPRRPVWLQEIGAPAPHIPAGHAAAFTRAT